MDKDTIFFSNRLISWYLTNKRNLPWRSEVSPYHVWLSEIILQQTKVAQGLPYYEAFVAKYPTVKDLANATEDEVLLLWQGLGYYSRARNLHASAKYIVKELNGVFPNTFLSLLALKGVGDYTASAIASICYNEPQAVVDGNVYRVLSRIFGIETIVPSSKAHKKFKELATLLMDKEQSGTFNQAMMEFGALQCIPRNPNCEQCIFASKCVALHKNAIHELPVKKKKAKVTKRYFNYFIVLSDTDSLVIQQRLDKDIWHKLYELPLWESNSALSKTQLKEIIRETPEFAELDSSSLQLINRKQIVHKLSHQHLHTKFWIIEGDMPEQASIPIEEWKNYAFPTLIEEFLSSFLVDEYLSFI
ncbi:MAG TPA: A/G-specific adenine glycosylase [Flavobacteriaceae bacterium]|nr:A/G-specific adenine glycosylase [Flavobacteriaceae bacterium]